MGRPASQPIYTERARSYASSALLLVLLGGGFLIDVSVGGGGVHLLAWLAAAVLIVGIDVITVRAARALRTLTVTETTLSLGAQVIARDQILGFQDRVDDAAPILGRGPGYGMPKGTRGLALHLADGGTIVVPSRDPERLAAALTLKSLRPIIRPADADDAIALGEIENRAQTLFRVAGLNLPGEWSAIAEIHGALGVLVSGRPADGFVRIGEVDGIANIAALGVIPGRLRKGVGRALVEAACAWAVARGYRAISVITYADVEWNAPFFTACGFATTTEIGPEMVELRDWETSIGLDTLGTRVVMRRELQPSGPVPA